VPLRQSFVQRTGRGYSRFLILLRVLILLVCVSSYYYTTSQAHPDRGGDPEEFVELQHAYTLISGMGGGSRSDRGQERMLAIENHHAGWDVGEKPTDCIDLEIRDHRKMFEAWLEGEEAGVYGRRV
jgi:hypothetical protein